MPWDSLMWAQKEFELSAKERGFHLITDEIVRAIPELRLVDCGFLHLIIKHTSASLTIMKMPIRQYAKIWKVTSINLCLKKRLTTCMTMKATMTCRPT
jgi:hypothetical protein